MKTKMKDSGSWEFEVSIEPLLNPKTGESTGRFAVYHGNRMIHICGHNFKNRTNKEAFKITKAIYEKSYFVDYEIESDRNGSYYAVLWTNKDFGNGVRFGVGVVNTHDGTQPFGFYPIAVLDDVVIPVGKPVRVYMGKDADKTISDLISGFDKLVENWESQIRAFFERSAGKTMTVVEAVACAKRVIYGEVESKTPKMESHRRTKLDQIVAELVALSTDGYVTVPDVEFSTLKILQSNIMMSTKLGAMRLYHLSIGKHRVRLNKEVHNLLKWIGKFSNDELAVAAKIIMSVIPQ